MLYTVKEKGQDINFKPLVATITILCACGGYPSPQTRRTPHTPWRHKVSFYGPLVLSSSLSSIEDLPQPEEPSNLSLLTQSCQNSLSACCLLHPPSRRPEHLHQVTEASQPTQSHHSATDHAPMLADVLHPTLSRIHHKGC